MRFILSLGSGFYTVVAGAGIALKTGRPGVELAVFSRAERSSQWGSERLLRGGVLLHALRVRARPQVFVALRLDSVELHSADAVFVREDLAQLVERHDFLHLLEILPLLVLLGLLLRLVVRARTDLRVFRPRQRHATLLKSRDLRIEALKVGVLRLRLDCRLDLIVTRPWRTRVLALLIFFVKCFRRSSWYPGVEHDLLGLIYFPISFGFLLCVKKLLLFLLFQFLFQFDADLGNTLFVNLRVARFRAKQRLVPGV